MPGHLPFPSNSSIASTSSSPTNSSSSLSSSSTSSISPPATIEIRSVDMDYSCAVITHIIGTFKEESVGYAVQSLIREAFFHSITEEV